MDPSTIEKPLKKNIEHERPSSTITLRTDFYLRKNKNGLLVTLKQIIGRGFVFRDMKAGIVHTVFFPPCFPRDYAFAINIFLLLLECMRFQIELRYVVKAYASLKTLRCPRTCRSVLALDSSTKSRRFFVHYFKVRYNKIRSGCFTVNIYRSNVYWLFEMFWKKGQVILLSFGYIWIRPVARSECLVLIFLHCFVVLWWTSDIGIHVLLLAESKMLSAQGSV